MWVGLCVWFRVRCTLWDWFRYVSFHLWRGWLGVGVWMLWEWLGVSVWVWMCYLDQYGCSDVTPPFAYLPLLLKIASVSWSSVYCSCLVVCPQACAVGFHSFICQGVSPLIAMHINMRGHLNPLSICFPALSQLMQFLT